jgi:cytoskeletal protein CcmA (bactofilin family)
MRTEPARGMVGNVAVIGPSMKVTGQIYSQEALYVDGEVDGSLELGHSLTVGQNGRVKANIKARDVTIFGNVKGNVEVTEKIAIRENGSLIGDIRTAGIVIDDGAYFKGSIDIMRPETARNGSAPQAAAETGT